VALDRKNPPFAHYAKDGAPSSTCDGRRDGENPRAGHPAISDQEARESLRRVHRGHGVRREEKSKMKRRGVVASERKNPSFAKDAKDGAPSSTCDGRRDGENPRVGPRQLEFEEFAEALGLLAGDGDFGLFFVVHFDHEAGFEPGDYFFNVVDVDEIGAVGAPEGVGVESGVEFFEGAALRGAFDIAGNNGNEAAFDGGEDEVAGVDQEHALLGLDEDFGGRFGGGFGGGELGDEFFEALGGAGVGFDFLFGFLDGFGDAGFVEGLEDVVDGVDVEGLYGVLVEGGGEDNVRDFELALD
jgi:hypothetical protein